MAESSEVVQARPDSDASKDHQKAYERPANRLDNRVPLRSERGGQKQAIQGPHRNQNYASPQNRPSMPRHLSLRDKAHELLWPKEWSACPFFRSVFLKAQPLFRDHRKPDAGEPGTAVKAFLRVPLLQF